jgi:hypothetical protein
MEHVSILLSNEFLKIDMSDRDVASKASSVEGRESRVESRESRVESRESRVRPDAACEAGKDGWRIAAD